MKLNSNKILRSDPVLKHDALKDSLGYLDVNKISFFASTLLWLLSGERVKPSIIQLAMRIKSLYKKNGSFFTVLYLKESHRLYMKALSGNPEICKTFPRVASRRGLPLIIPGHLRLKIEAGDLLCIRLVHSLLTVYRVIKTLPILKLESITAPFKGLNSRFPQKELDIVLGKFLRITSLGITPTEDVLISTKAGPNFRTSVLGATLDAIAFRDNPLLLGYLKEVAALTGPKIADLLDKEISNLPTWFDSIKESLRSVYLSECKLGKLSEKEEAAGKVRIFAITDVWTQSVLHPLHKAIFNQLRNLPTDGTFDQLAPLKRLIDRGHKEFYSYDLSAATDRLPIDCQIQILSKLTNPRFAAAWGKLLVSRPWYLKGVPYFYSVGQPMGALSSWAMLALCHHILVQIAARRVGKRFFFSEYAVLGDDIVIADSAVAQSYLTVITDLGVEVNLSKSLTSVNGVLEFAKRLISDGIDISPLPPKLVLLLTKSIRQLPTVLRDMIQRGISVTTDMVLINNKVTRPILMNIIGPFGLLPSEGLTPLLGANSLSEEELKEFLRIYVGLINRHIIAWFYKNQNESQLLVDRVGSLIWDRCLVRNGTIKIVDINYDTPFFHKVMDQTINRTIEENTSEPELLQIPSDFEYTFENVYSFLKVGMSHLDSYSTSLVDFSVKDDKSPSLSSFKHQFYRELDRELSNSGTNFAFLTKGK